MSRARLLGSFTLAWFLAGCGESAGPGTGQQAGAGQSSTGSSGSGAGTGNSVGGTNAQPMAGGSTGGASNGGASGGSSPVGDGAGGSGMKPAPTCSDAELRSAPPAGKEALKTDPIDTKFPFSTHWMGRFSDNPAAVGITGLADFDNDGDLDFASGQRGGGM